MANVGVTFDFAAESAKLRTEIDKVRKELSSINKTRRASEKRLKLVGSAIVGAFSIGAITGFLSGRSTQAADTLNDLSTAAGCLGLRAAVAAGRGSARRRLGRGDEDRDLAQDP